MAPRPLPTAPPEDPDDSPVEGGHALVAPVAFLVVLALGVSGGVLHGVLDDLGRVAVTSAALLAGGGTLVAALCLTRWFDRLVLGGVTVLLTAGWLSGLWQGPSLVLHVLVAGAAFATLGVLTTPAGPLPTLPTTRRGPAPRHRAARRGAR